MEVTDIVAASNALLMMIQMGAYPIGHYGGIPRHPQVMSLPINALPLLMKFIALNGNIQNFD